MFFVDVEEVFGLFIDDDFRFVCFWEVYCIFNEVVLGVGIGGKEEGVVYFGFYFCNGQCLWIIDQFIIFVEVVVVEGDEFKEDVVVQ